MSKRLPFTKMHGLGNDFVVIDQSRAPDWPRLSPDLAKRVCDRRFGIGADQILHLVEPKDPSAAPLRMEIWNSDGSTSEMCGNGIRAVGLYLKNRNRVQSDEPVSLETEKGVQVIQLDDRDWVTVEMGEPKVSPLEKLSIDGREFEFQPVEIGNPHAVILTDEASDILCKEWGPKIEVHSRFPQKVNVGFARALSQSQLDLFVWERGAGFTLACGSGACAAAASAISRKASGSPIQVNLPGGQLEVEWGGPGSSLTMKGPATEVYEGEFALD